MIKSKLKPLIRGEDIENEKNQSASINNDLDLIATKAFGMGIDNRYVMHLNYPDSIESCYQEVGEKVVVKENWL